MNSTGLTIIIASIIGFIFVAIVVKIIIDKKKGKHSCSCGGNCQVCGICTKYTSGELKEQNDNR